jgi:hypothetical protein
MGRLQRVAQRSVTLRMELFLMGVGCAGTGAWLWGWRDEDGGFGHAAMAGAAVDVVFWFGISELGEELGVDGVGHLHHDASAVFHGIGVGGEVEAASGVVFGVAIVAADAEFAFPGVHDGDNLLGGHVLGENFEVGRRGHGTALACGRRRGLLRESRDGDCEREGGEKTQRAGHHVQSLWNADVRLDAKSMERLGMCQRASEFRWRRNVPTR